MRIVTRPDFDGIVCVVLIQEAENSALPVLWASPNDMQRGLVDIQAGDIIANLPYNSNCDMWFDHHFSNQIRHPVKGLFEIAPSAAGLVYRYYRDRIQKDYSTLVAETDKIDSANLALNEILTPENYPYVLLSMTIQDHVLSDAPYWDRVVTLLKKHDIETILRDREVQKRSQTIIQENRDYRNLLDKYTRLEKQVAISDFRDLDSMPYGNRFLVYSMFPEATVSVKIGFEDANKEIVVVKVGHSILNRNCQVNVGQMLSYFDGGGHKGVGSCKFPTGHSEKNLRKIIDILKENEPEGSIVVKVQRQQQDRRGVQDRRQSGPDSVPKDGMPERRKGERRGGKEHRRDWKRTTKWKSIKITL
jgi:oligoribonuclease NrnB/cAMP/cGMP phosphodiesterase (DHH superfamily)